MKNYYDLTNKEKGKYIDEFKKTPGGKSSFDSRAKSLIGAIIMFVLGVILSFFFEDSSEVMNTITAFTLIAFCLALIYCTSFEISFCSWLKIKHDIKRW